MTKNRTVRTILCALLIGALLLPMLPSASRADGDRYGKVTTDRVRFRMAPTTGDGGEWWCMLDEGWTVVILENVTANGYAWYHVRTNIPGSTGKNYSGYIMQEFVYEMSASDITAFMQNPVQPNGEKAYLPGDGSTPVNPGDATEPPAGSATPTPTPAGDITPTPAATATATATSGNTQWGETIVDKVFFRHSPGSDGYYALLPLGWRLKILGSTVYNGIVWYHVEGGTNLEPDAVYDGYIHSEFFRPVSADVTPTPTPTPTVTAPVMSGYAMITVEGTVLRKTASSKGQAITSLSYGTLVQVLAEKNGYFSVTVNGNTGFVLKDSAKELTQSEYDELINPGTPTPTVTATATAADVTPTPAADTVMGYIKLIKEGVNLRAEPAGNTLTPSSSDWLHKDTVLPYYALPVFKDGYNWIRVKYNDMFGYIRSDCYEFTEGGDVTPAPTTEAPLGGYIRLIKDNVNLRRTAGGNVIAQLKKGTVLAYFGTDTVDNVMWYYVYSTDLAQYGYIMGTMAETISGPTEVPSTPTPTPTATTPGAVTPTPTPSVVDDYAITTADKVYLRQEASTGSQPLDQIASKGTIMQMWGSPVSGSGNIIWYPVIYNGLKGYVHGSFSRMLTDAEKEEYKKSGKLPTPTPTVTATPTGAVPTTPGSVTPTPTVTSVPTLAPSGHIIITADKVFVRSGAGTNYAPIGNGTQVNTGDVFAYDTAILNGNITWYRIQYSSTVIAYIHGSFARVMTEQEYQDYIKGVTPTPIPPVTATPTATPTATATTPGFVVLEIGSTGESVTQVQQKLYELGYLAQSEITGNYQASTMNAVLSFQNAKGLTATGKVDEATWNALFTDSGKTPYYVEGSSVSVELNPVEMVDWFTGDIQTVWAKGSTAIVTDVYTGISFQARRWSGGNHADVEPLTSADTASICKIMGVSTAQEIQDRYDELQSWRRRPAWITIGDRTFAASLYLVPHNYPDGDTIPDNNFNGQFCVHFVNSMTHGNASNPASVDYDKAANGYFGHQSAIKYAYDHSISGKK